MAATDRVQIFFTQTGDRFWTNVYHVNALTLDAAADWANTILATAMQIQMNEAFQVTKTVVNHLADNSFRSTPMSLPGATSGDYYPLFNTVKVDISVAGSGRNDGKFLRGWLHEGVVTGGIITPAVRIAYEGVMNDLIADSATSGVDLVDDAGNVWILATVRSKVQERQLHRRRRLVVVP